MRVILDWEALAMVLRDAPAIRELVGSGFRVEPFEELGPSEEFVTRGVEIVDDEAEGGE